MVRNSAILVDEEKGTWSPVPFDLDVATRRSWLKWYLNAQDKLVPGAFGPKYIMHTTVFFFDFSRVPKHWCGGRVQYDSMYVEGYDARFRCLRKHLSIQARQRHPAPP